MSATSQLKLESWPIFETFLEIKRNTTPGTAESNHLYFKPTRCRIPLV